ncbi:hypothetical protein NIES2135_14860 [Leptolyngbya boryana NIES-2135]|uniref:Uncharacterized protein n=1 Tax=Leptolyngbya boryana NIES-2135 TaxID=1973484 RepID=A0A1Z4JDB7_LEPBY|nr:hypothetical protein NIES2135_14860 [Leptolyngbya boryana NIES-2135]
MHIAVIPGLSDKSHEICDAEAESLFLPLGRFRFHSFAGYAVLMH